MTGFMLYQKLNGKWRDDKMSDKYQNTELIPEERAAYLLEELSLDEKVAQLNCVFPFDKASYDFAGINEQTKHGIGQVSTLEMRRMESLDEVVRAENRYGKQSAPYSGNFSYGRTLWSIYSGFHKLSFRNWKGCRMESKVGGENCRNCKPSGSCLWYYACLCPCA